MKDRCLASIGALAAVIAVSLAPALIAGQAPPAAKGTAAAGAAPRTAWGAPDLQGIWNSGAITPFERPKEYGNREFLTEQERAEREKQLAERADAAKGGLTGYRDKRKEQGTEQDVAGAYNAIWEGIPVTKVGRRIAGDRSARRKSSSSDAGDQEEARGTARLSQHAVTRQFW